MASFCRSTTLLSRARSVTFRSKALLSSNPSAKPSLSPSPLPSPAVAAARPSRVLSALGSVESMMPLHTAIASTRLKSCIAVDSTCWSWLSQGRALPL